MISNEYARCVYNECVLAAYRASVRRMHVCVRRFNQIEASGIHINRCLKEVSSRIEIRRLVCLDLLIDITRDRRASQQRLKVLKSFEHPRALISRYD